MPTCSAGWPLRLCRCYRRAYRPSTPGSVSTTADAVWRNERGGQNHLPHPRRSELSVTTPGTVSPAIEWPTMTRSSIPAPSMSDDQGVHPVGDGGRSEVAGLSAAAGKVDGEHGEFRCLPVDFVDGGIPAVAGMLTTMDEHQRGQCHGASGSVARTQNRIVKLAPRRCPGIGGDHLRAGVLHPRAVVDERIHLGHQRRRGRPAARPPPARR